MVLNVFHFQCECGWNKQWVTGGFSRKKSLVEIVERQLLESENPKSKSVWRNIYQQILKEQLLPEQLIYKSGLAICFHCKSSNEQIALYDSSSGFLLHSLLCNQCGNDIFFYSQPEGIRCPSCQQMVCSGPPLSTEEKLKNMLNQCKITNQSGDLNDNLIAVGEKAASYSKDLELPLITIEKHLKAQNNLDFLNEIPLFKKMILLTSFDDEFEAELVMLLLHQFNRENQLIPVVITPPSFEGKRRRKRIMDHITNLQKVSKNTILISGAALEKEYGPSIQIYDKYIPEQIKKVLHFIIEGSVQ
jgi:ribosomal protein S27E